MRSALVHFLLAAVVVGPAFACDDCYGANDVVMTRWDSSDFVMSDY